MPPCISSSIRALRSELLPDRYSRIRSKSGLGVLNDRTASQDLDAPRHPWNLLSRVIRSLQDTASPQHLEIASFRSWSRPYRHKVPVPAKNRVCGHRRLFDQVPHLRQLFQWFIASVCYPLGRPLFGVNIESPTNRGREKVRTLGRKATNRWSSSAVKLECPVPAGWTMTSPPLSAKSKPRLVEGSSVSSSFPTPINT